MEMEMEMGWLGSSNLEDHLRKRPSQDQCQADVHVAAVQEQEQDSLDWQEQCAHYHSRREMADV